jgi:TonB family protein
VFYFLAADEASYTSPEPIEAYPYPYPEPPEKVAVLPPEPEPASPPEAVEPAVTKLEDEEPADDGVGMGSLSKDAIQRVIKNHVSEIKYCYEQDLAVSPSLQGKVTVKIVIGKKGRVEEAEVTSTSLNRPAVEKCIENKIKKWKFPAPEGGKVVVSYPFVLTSG